MKLTITISEETFRYIETLGALFPWLVEDAPDYGRVLEEYSAYRLKELATNDCGELSAEIENFFYVSKEEANGMIERFNARFPNQSDMRSYNTSDGWRIMAFRPGTWGAELFEFCIEHGIDYDKHEREFRSVANGDEAEQQATLQLYKVVVLKRLIRKEAA